MALLLAGLPKEVPGTTINRLCGSGMDAVITAARAIKAGEAELMIAGGVESMSRAPFVMPKADDGLFAQRRDLRHDDRLALRQPADEEAVRRRFHAGDRRERRRRISASRAPTRTPSRCAASRRRRPRRRTAGSAKEITPVTIPQRKGDAVVVGKDEHPRAGTTLETLAKLPTPFREGGTVTAGNASGVNDGAAALIVASEAAAKKYGLTPIARILGGADRRRARRASWASARSPATRKLCARLGLEPDRFRRRRAQRGLRLAGHRRAARARHRRGCSAREPERRRDRARPSARHVRRPHRRHRGAGAAANAAQALALATMCIGVGQGIAMALERA